MNLLSHSREARPHRWAKALALFTVTNTDTDTSEVEPDTVFRIASITKSMTAATLADLAEDGLIDLDAPVVDYLGPDWVPGQRVVVYSHSDGTAGFRSEAGYLTGVDAATPCRPRPQPQATM